VPAKAGREKGTMANANESAPATVIKDRKVDPVNAASKAFKLYRKATAAESKLKSELAALAPDARVLFDGFVKSTASVAAATK
jgi:hypothetical protein